MTTSSKNLHVTFAMGGGVSLGSFSGGALTEALWSLILYGQDDEGNPYRRVVLDSMSGASAGAISLAAMLRELLRNEREGSNEGNEKMRQARAVKRAQKVQKQLWVDLLKMKDFCLEKGDSQQSFGLLSQKIMKQIIRKQILSDVGQISYDSSCILADRVLFACSLTNLQPISLSPQDSEDFPLVKEAYKSTTSYEHKELRVFDLRFKEQEAGEIDHWFTYNMEELKNKESWAELSATAVACGAFPVAFEPVILERTKEEFSHILSLDGADSRHPYHFISNFDHFKFPYVDGGTFNNEPIREAFRLAYHLDSENRRKHPKQDFDRLVIFVDPIVSPDSPGFNISAFDPYRFSGGKVKKKNELGKLFPLASTMIGMMRDEGSVKEENKIRNFKQTVKLRKTLFNYLDDIINQLPSSALEAELWDSLVDSVEKRLKRNFIPLGDGEAEDYLLKKLEANYELVSREPEITSRASTQSDQFDFFEQIVSNLLQTRPGFEKLEGMLNHLQQATDPEMITRIKTTLRKAFLNLLVDFAVDLDGKDEKAMRVSVTPVAYGKLPEELKTIKLPGSEMEAFTGFGVKDFQFVSFNYGRYCALKALSRNDFRMYHFQSTSKKKVGEKLPFISPNQAEKLIEEISLIPEEPASHDEYLQEIKQNLFRPLTKRVGSLFSLWIRNPIVKSIIGIGVWLPRYTLGNNWLIFREVGRDIFEKKALPGITILLKGDAFKAVRKYRFDSNMPWMKGLWDESANAFVIKAFLNLDQGKYMLSHLHEKDHQFQLVPRYIEKASGPYDIQSRIEVKPPFCIDNKKKPYVKVQNPQVETIGKVFTFTELLDKMDLFNNPVFVFDGTSWSLEDRVKPFAKIILGE